MAEYRKLNIQERIRLEALNQAVGSLSLTESTTDTILTRAKVFETYLKTGAANAKDQ